MPRKIRPPRLELVGDRWYCFWYNADAGRTKRVSLGTADKNEAQRRFAALLLEGDRVARQGPAGQLSVTGVLAAYRAEHVTDHVVDRARAEWAMKNLLAGFAESTVADLDPAAILGYVTHRTAGKIGRPSGPGTIRRELGVLVAAMNHAVRSRRLTRDQLPHIAMPSSPPPRERWLTGNEAGALLKVTEPTPRERETGIIPRVHTFIRIALATAARRRSIERLTWFQVDLERGTIDFRTPGERVTKKRRVVVPIADELKPFLVGLRAAAKTEYVLRHPGSVRKQFERACVRAKIADVTPHTLRHTWATWAAQAGVDLWQVAGVLGDSMATVTRVYAKHNPEHLRAAVNFGVSLSVTPRSGV